MFTVVFATDGCLPHAPTTLHRPAPASTGIAAIRMRFEELTYDQEFEGIWACASLLHVPLAELPDSVGRLRRALKPYGVCFMSFKHGTGERMGDGRWFVDFTEATLSDALRKVDGLTVIQIWVTAADTNRDTITWVNVLVRRET